MEGKEMNGREEIVGRECEEVMGNDSRQVNGEQDVRHGEHSHSHSEHSHHSHSSEHGEGHEHHHHEHQHGHHHGHHHHHGHGVTRITNAFKIGILLNVAYVVVEGVFGFISDSMGLLSDAGHNLSDVASLLISFLAIKAMARKPNDGFTYGYRKSTVVASVVNAVILYVAVIMILIESIDKLVHPVDVNGSTVAWVAAAGVLINGATAWLFMKDSKRDINIKGAYLHMAADTMVSIGVVVAGIVIATTHWTLIDPIIGICIAVLIAISSWSLLRESLRMAFDGVPSSVDINKVRGAILGVKEVKEMHHLHVWSLSTTDTAMTVHVLVENPNSIDAAIVNVRNAVKDFGINHATIEAETAETEDCHSAF